MSEEKFCYKYPHPAVTVDCVIFGFNGSDLNVLLVQRAIDPYKGCWAFPGGFVQIDESSLDAARRELKEETDLETDTLTQFHTFDNPLRDPRERVITIAHYALVKMKDVIGGDDAAAAKWFPVSKIPGLAFDHDMILRYAMAELRRKIHFEPIGFDLLPEKFSMKELQTLYEAVLGVKFDRRNFYNKMKHIGILEELKETRRQDTKREVLLYSFNRERYDELKRDNFKLEF